MLTELSLTAPVRRGGIADAVLELVVADIVADAIAERVEAAGKNATPIAVYYSAVGKTEGDD